MPTHMLNGLGQTFFIGNTHKDVSQFDSSGQVSPGQGYVPDEVARMLVKEAGLHKSDTVSKKVIVGFLESMGLSGTLATDVAMVLRNMYGITPTFDESTDNRSGNLMEEIRGIVSESYPAPFIDRGPEILTEEEVFAEAIQNEFNNAGGLDEEVVIAHMAQLSPSEVVGIADLFENLTEEQIEVLEALSEDGAEHLFPEVIESWFNNNPFKSFTEEVEYISERSISIARELRKKGRGPGAERERLKKKFSPNMMKKFPAASKVLAKHDAGVKSGESQAKSKQKKASDDWKRTQRARTKSSGQDPMAARKSGRMLDMKRKDQAKETHRIAMSRDKEGPALPKDVKPGAMKRAGDSLARVVKGAKEKVAGHVPALARLGRAGIGALKGGAAAAKQGYSTDKSADKSAADKRAASIDKPATDPSLLRKVGSAATKVAKGLGRFAVGAATGAYAAAKNTAKKEFPGISSQIPKAKAAAGKAKAAAGAYSKGRNPDLRAQESVYRNSEFLAEAELLFGGPPAEEKRPVRLTTREVAESIEGITISESVVLECLSQMKWEDVADIASILLLPEDEIATLCMSLREGTSEFRREWRSADERGVIPEGVKRSSFMTLSKVGLGEGMASNALKYSAILLGGADGFVESYVKSSYPVLGKTIYSPAGDPKQGPRTAMAYMLPHMAQTDLPDESRVVQPLRLFTDKGVRDKIKTARLKEVMKIIGSMEIAASEAGVHPDGMFLNKWRDMHREKARYS